MTEPLFILAVVIVTALVFDFTNGFHDTGNAMATSIATGALRPKVAVALSAVLNLVGAFLSIEVALTVSNKVVAIQGPDGAPIPGLMGTPILTIVLAGLVGGILWNLLTWLLGLPSSSSHALFGGLIGAAVAALGLGGVKWDGVTTAVIIPAVAAPVVAGLVALVGTRVIYALVARVPGERRDAAFRWGQVGSASLVSLAHGTNDAQKTMGVITLALIADQQIRPGADPPMWVIVSCGVALAAGTYFGGWRVIRTMGHRLTHIESPQGFTAETSAVAVLLTAAQGGLPLSTTHITAGAVLGSGLGRRGAGVRWRVAGTMLIAWLLTLPAAGLIAAGIALIVVDGGSAPITLVSIASVALLLGFWLWSRRNPVGAQNVNDPAENFGRISSIERPVLEQAAG